MQTVNPSFPAKRVGARSALKPAPTHSRKSR